MTCWLLCDRWIDEVKGERCVLDDGHTGECTAQSARRMTLADYAEAGVAPPELVEALTTTRDEIIASGVCPSCGEHDSTEGILCEGCGECQACCNCTDTDCDCDACTERRENESD